MIWRRKAVSTQFVTGVRRRGGNRRWQLELGAVKILIGEGDGDYEKNSDPGIFAGDALHRGLRQFGVREQCVFERHDRWGFLLLHRWRWRLPGCLVLELRLHANRRGS